MPQIGQAVIAHGAEQIFGERSADTQYRAVFPQPQHQVLHDILGGLLPLDIHAGVGAERRIITYENLFIRLHLTVDQPVQQAGVGYLFPFGHDAKLIKIRI